MKHYDKFYEIGNNSYYKITADDDLYLATESFLNLGKRGLFRKQERLTQGFKLLKVSPAVGVLFNELVNLNKLPNQKGISEDMLKYRELNDNIVKEKIEDSYNCAFAGAIKELDDWYKEREKDLKEKYKVKEITENTLKLLLTDCANTVKQHKEVINRNNPLENGMISIKEPKHTGSKIVKAMINSGLKHLYTEKVTSFANNIFLYEVDMFGTLTIYRIMEVKGVLKGVDSFVYDKKLIEEFLKVIYEEER